MSLFSELKRRNVFKIGVAYGVASWLLLQIVDLVLENINAPDWVMQVFMLALAVGFPIAIIIAWAFEVTPEGVRLEKNVDRSESIANKTGQHLNRGIIMILAVAVVFLLTDRFRDEVLPIPGNKGTSKENTSNGAAPTDIDSNKSIAVLPFTNMSADASNEYFSDGISEEILNLLAKVRELKVAGRTSAFAFKGRNEDLREIGEALGVSHILEGSVRKAGNKVRVTAQLIQVSDGFHLWSDTYDRELTDIFAIQDEIANAILQELKAELISGQSIASERVDPVVYEKYLLAKQRIYSRNLFELESAADLLREATDIDPGFAPAWAQLGIATLLLADDAYGAIPHADSQRLSKVYLQKALDLDKNQAEALAGMGLFYRNEPGGTSAEETAIDYLQRALEINPSYIDASNWLQLAYANLGRTLDSLRILEDMVNRDPLYKPGVGNLIWAYSVLGQIETAQRLLERVRPFIRDEGYIARFEANILLSAGRFGDAYSKARLGYEIDSKDFNSSLTLGWNMSGLGLDEELAELETAPAWLRLNAMMRLGRKEEGRLFARDWTDRLGDPSLMITYFHNTRQAKALTDYIDNRWPDLSVLESELTGLSGSGHQNMIMIAHAYKQTGKFSRFEQARNFARAEHDHQYANGFDTLFFNSAESSYWAMAGDVEKSLEHMEIAIDKGMSFPLSDLNIFPEFDGLLSEERFRVLSRIAHERFNQQRVLAGLEPISPERTL